MTSLELPDGYAELLAKLGSEVRTARAGAVRSANAELIRLYWAVGKAVLQQQAERAWGAKVIERLAADLRAEFPDMSGWNRANLYAMRSLAEACPEWGSVSTALRQIPWSHIRLLTSKVSDPADREWYAQHAAEQGWTLVVLQHHVATGLHRRIAAAPSSFALHLDDEDARRAQLLTRDPYVFDFLTMREQTVERDLERALMDRLQDTLMEFGREFAFVGRRVNLEVDGDDFFIDLLLFHTRQLRYVVVELKVGKFKPDYTGQLSFYVAVVDDQIRNADLHAPTVGILLCASRNAAVVRYALASSTAPLAVASYAAEHPPDPAELNLPRPDELTAILTTPLPGTPGSTLADALPAEDTD